MKKCIDDVKFMGKKVLMRADFNVPIKNGVITLVDYHNNVIEQSLESFRKLGNRLYGVRIDTSKNMKDKMF
ncbi:phosphoglycerate kinase, partial [Mycoplasmopsis bovis]|uniref:phosphoglycerate kinase n=1 Tax=Mycoplasmopsis bovis TaxID=28903 RepID=UPI003D2CE019